MVRLGQTDTIASHAGESFCGINAFKGPTGSGRFSHWPSGI
ncbi:hypothetical protein SAMN02799636_05988 [Methylobacterium sp. 275MFSha3.1]|nr:hypothetical protein SAMN02799636_05988 [Methylobacterium sp. 275MFSha3.1]